MAYKKVQRVANMMIDYQSARLLDYVTDVEEKAFVWQTVLDYFEKAREKGAEVQFEMPKVSKASENAIKGMIESIDDGIYKFWKMVDKNTQARNQNNNNILQLDDHRSTIGQPQADQSLTTDDHRLTNISKVKYKESEVKENTQYNTVQHLNFETSKYHKTSILNSERADEYKRILDAMEKFGYDMNANTEESVAYNMNVNWINEEDVYDALNICKNKNNRDISYFFAILIHKANDYCDLGLR